jgi:hypothetical protein
MSFTKLKPSIWADANGILILDLDGWRNKSFNEPITEEEFFERAAESTCTGRMESFTEYFASLIISSSSKKRP